MAKKKITLKEFADELDFRLKAGKTIDCCKQELVSLAGIIRKKLPQEIYRGGLERIDFDCILFL